MLIACLRISEFGGPPAGLVPLVLDHNLRNTRQIANSFSSLAPIRMRAADDVLLDDGWRSQDVALLTTGSRHPEQVQRQAAGQGVYWNSFWDEGQVFYGHVLGFKGLERSAVVLALNAEHPGERSKERLYDGLSRPRDQLVVCGDPEFIVEVGGHAVLRRLEHR